jgi:hypothetical protein
MCRRQARARLASPRPCSGITAGLARTGTAPRDAGDHLNNGEGQPPVRPLPTHDELLIQRPQDHRHSAKAKVAPRSASDRCT